MGLASHFARDRGTGRLLGARPLPSLSAAARRRRQGRGSAGGDLLHDPLASSREVVQKAAQGECAPDTVAVARVRPYWKLDNCPLLLPARATFVCAPKK